MLGERLIWRKNKINDFQLLQYLSSYLSTIPSMKWFKPFSNIYCLSMNKLPVDPVAWLGIMTISTLCNLLAFPIADSGGTLVKHEWGSPFAPSAHLQAIISSRTAHLQLTNRSLFLLSNTQWINMSKFYDFHNFFAIKTHTLNRSCFKKSCFF